MCDKRTLRAQFARIRAGARSAEKDAAITENVLRSPLFCAESFFVYCSVRSEVPTDGLIAALLAAGKRVCVPRIAHGAMLSVPYAPLAAGAFGIPAPSGGEDTPCEVALAPLLAVDADGYRLGYGGGYYDRYLGKVHAFLLGICYTDCIVGAVPTGAHDVFMDALACETGILRIGG